MHWSQFEGSCTEGHLARPASDSSSYSEFPQAFSPAALVHSPELFLPQEGSPGCKELLINKPVGQITSDGGEAEKYAGEESTKHQGMGHSSPQRRNLGSQTDWGLTGLEPGGSCSQILRALSPCPDGDAEMVP